MNRADFETVVTCLGILVLLCAELGIIDFIYAR